MSKVMHPGLICRHAVMMEQTLRKEQLDDNATLRGVHRVEFPKPVPESVKQKIGYCIEKTLKLLRENWSPRQKELLQLFDPALAKVGDGKCDRVLMFGEQKSDRFWASNMD